MAAATTANVNGQAADTFAIAGASPANSTSGAVATPGSPNGSQSGSQNGSQNVNAKRKRDDSDSDNGGAADADQEMTDAPSATQPVKASPAPSTLVDKTKVETTASSDKEATPGPATTSTAGNRDEKRLIRDYFDVLLSFDKSVPSLLKRALPEAAQSDEPIAKRQRQDGSATPSTKPTTAQSISEKVESDAYALLDDLVLDVAAIVASELAALEDKPFVKAADSADKEAEDKKETESTDDKDKSDNAQPDKAKEEEQAKRIAIAHIAKLRDFAYDLYRRETVYPKSGPLHGKDGGKINATSSLAVATPNRGLPVLTVFGNAPGPRQLFSSLPTLAASSESDVEEIVREDEDYEFGGNITLTRTFAPPQAEKQARVLTFGELFTSPRNLPSLQPPKLPKSTTKSSTLSFYHPELTENSKYRSGSYATQHITAGQWLDYSNATPTSPVRTRQRERAQSLAGHKPSMAELELSEAENLFRGAFSSFAPSHDDSGAIVPAAQMGRMWWQRVGHRVFQRMAESELYDDDDEEVDEATTPPDATHSGLGAPITLDEEALQKTIDEWDDNLVDPSLEQVMGQKSQVDKDADEVLQEVSDLIVTLASYQRNRNLTLPTSQDRYSADPVNGDMLRDGTLAQQPSEEEVLTYETLKAQLSLIISGLPPYAVARLNSDKLEELNISTKIEVRSEEYRGILEEDEAVVRARQAAQAAQAAQAHPSVAAPQRAPSHRAASTSVSSSHNYGAGQFNTPTRAAMAVPGSSFFPSSHSQTPSRAVSQPHRPSVGGMPLGTPVAALPPHVRPGAAGQSQFRPSPNGYNGYQPTTAKTGVPPQPQFRQPALQPQLPPGGYPGTPGAQQAHMSPQRIVSQPQPGAYGGQIMQPPQQQQQQQQQQQAAPGTPQQFRYPPGTPGYPQQQQQRRPSQSVPYPGSPANGIAHLAPQQQPSPQPRFHPSPSPMTAGLAQPGPQQPLMTRPPPPYTAQQLQQQQHIMQQQQQQIQQQQQQQQQQRQFSGAGAGTPGGGPFGYHTVMDQPQQQRVMEQARARASAHERSVGFGDKISQGAAPGGPSNGQVAGLAGIGLGGAGNPAVDMSKLAAARANMPGGGMMSQQQQQQQQQQQRLSPMPQAGMARPSMSPSPVQYAQPHPQMQMQQQPQQYQQQVHHQHHPSVSPQPFLAAQQQQRPMASPSPVGSLHSMNGTPQAMAPPPPQQQQQPMQMSVSPATTGGFQRPA